MLRLLIKTLLLSTLLIDSLNARTFVEPIISTATDEKDYLFDDSNQPISEIIGISATTYGLRVGSNSYIDKTNLATVWVSGYFQPDKFNEMGMTFGGKWTNFVTKNLGLSIGGEISYGWQDNNGDTVNLSTGVTKAGYIQSSAEDNPTTGTFNQDTVNLKFSLILGTEYKVSDDLYFNLEGFYDMQNYQVNYTVYGQNSQNALTIRQDTYGLRFGLRYVFDFTLDTSNESFFSKGSYSSPVNMSVFK